MKWYSKINCLTYCTCTCTYSLCNTLCNLNLLTREPDCCKHRNLPISKWSKYCMYFISMIVAYMVVEINFYSAEN